MCQFLVWHFVGFATGLGSARSREIVTALYANNLPVSHAEIEAHQGHDAFLVSIAQYVDVLGGCMDRVDRECGA